MIAVLAIAAALVTASSAAAAGVVIDQQTFDLAGDPVVAGGSSPNIPASWSICAPSSACIPAPSDDGLLEPGPEPAGTVFDASVTVGGQTYTAQSAVWQGTIQSTAPPMLTGLPRVGATVTPVAGTWRGGWSHGGDEMSVEACKTESGTGCVVLSSTCGCYVGSAPAAVVGGWYAGWYLFAVDKYLGAVEYSTGIFYIGGPTGVPLPGLGQTIVRSAPVGPVVGPPAPYVSIFSRATVRDGKANVARVRCSGRCDVTFAAYPYLGRQTQVVVKRSGLIRISSWHLRHLKQVDVSIRVEGSPEIDGQTRLSDVPLETFPRR